MHHLIDFTLSNGRVAACGAGDRSSANHALDSHFKALPFSERCKECEGHLKLAETFMRTCRVCGKLFASPNERGEHESQHIVTPVYYRDEQPSYVLDVQRFYDDTSTVARRLTAARAELATAEASRMGPVHQYDFIPTAHILVNNNRANSNVIGGDLYPTKFLMIPR